MTSNCTLYVVPETIDGDQLAAYMISALFMVISLLLIIAGKSLLALLVHRVTINQKFFLLQRNIKQASITYNFIAYKICNRSNHGIMTYIVHGWYRFGLSAFLLYYEKALWDMCTEIQLGTYLSVLRQKMLWYKLLT